MVAMRTYLALGLVLVVLTSPARGQSWDSWFRVSWGPEANGKTPTARIEASVHNDSPYRVTDVELAVEGSAPTNILWASASCGRWATSTPVANRHS